MRHFKLSRVRALCTKWFLSLLQCRENMTTVPWQLQNKFEKQSVMQPSSLILIITQKLNLFESSEGFITVKYQL